MPSIQCSLCGNAIIKGQSPLFYQKTWIHSRCFEPMQLQQFNNDNINYFDNDNPNHTISDQLKQNSNNIQDDTSVEKPKKLYPFQSVDVLMHRADLDEPQTIGNVLKFTIGNLLVIHSKDPNVEKTWFPHHDIIQFVADHGTFLIDTFGNFDILDIDGAMKSEVHTPFLLRNTARLETEYSIPWNSLFSLYDSFMAIPSISNGKTKFRTPVFSNHISHQPLTKQDISIKRPFDTPVEKTVKQPVKMEDIPLYIVPVKSLISLVANPVLPVTEHPFNRVGYKYACATPDIHLKHSEFHECFVTDMSATKFQCQEFKNVLNPLDGNPFLVYNEEKSIVTTMKGWCSVRGSCAVKTGSWYYEVRVEKGGGEGKMDSRTGSYCRIGWGRRETMLDCPTGSDSYSYGYRDFAGEAMHEARRSAYGESYGTGDVIGCLIELGAYHPSMHWPVGFQKRKRVLIKYKGHIYYESKDFAPLENQEIKAILSKLNSVAAKRRKLLENTDPKKKSRAKNPFSAAAKPAKKEDLKDLEMEYEAHLKDLDRHFRRTPNGIPVIRNSRIQFFKNGICQGDAFRELPVPIAAASLIPPHNRKPKEVYLPSPPAQDDGSLGYYPMLSVFKGGKVKVNFGPDFDFPPPFLDENIAKRSVLPLCERMKEMAILGYVADIYDEVELSLEIQKGVKELVSEKTCIERSGHSHSKTESCKENEENERENEENDELERDEDEDEIHERETQTAIQGEQEH